jgi:UDP-glucose 4-epimerase
MQNIAVTGASGYIGTQLIKQLEKDETVQNIIGISRRPPQVDSKKLKFYSHDIREPFDRIFIENDVDTAVHLAFTVSATRDNKTACATDIGGSLNFLKACKGSSVKRISFLSSYTAYGAHPDNPERIDETASLRPNQGLLYPNNKAEADKLFQEFMARNPGLCVSIIRAVVVAGPESDGGPLASFLKNPVAVCIKGYDPEWQFVHEKDLIDLIVFLLKKGHTGVFNAAADGCIRYSEMIAKIGKKCISLPDKVSSLITTWTWKLHLQSDAPGGESMALVKYPIIVNTEKLRKATGFQFKYTSLEAFQAFLDAVRSNA